jgi:hypothetical protein
MTGMTTTSARRSPFLTWAPTGLLGPAALLMAAHGLVHLIGVFLYWRIAEPGELRYTDLSPEPGTVPALLVGAVWLAAAVLFVLAAASLLRRQRTWWWIALAATVVSLPVLVLAADVAPIGLILDGLILTALALVRMLWAGR